MVIKIEALYFLLLAEGALILLALTVYFYSQAKKFRKLYQRVVKDIESAKVAPEPAEDKPLREEPVEEKAVEEIKEEPQPEPEAAEGMTAQPEEGMHMERQEEGTEVEDGDASPLKVKKLQRMLKFQKEIILELMCYKEIFEGAHKKLSALKQTNSELQEKIGELAESGAGKEGFLELQSALENNNLELEKFINILDKENAMLSNKFSEWENEFKRISEDAGDDGNVPGVDEGQYGELVKEKEILVVKVKEYEEKLQESVKQMGGLQSQYEDLEKEYMVLYRQQQQQQQQQQQ